MPSRESIDRIRDILAAIKRIEKRTAEVNFSEFEANDTIANACLYDFMIIGEAAINIDTELKTYYSQIPGRLMGDMRNVIAHEYFQVELDIVWHTIQNYLPPLIPQLEAILQQEGVIE